MNGVLWVVIGILIGGSFIGIGVFFYVMFTALRAVTAEIKALRETIQPVFSNEDIMRGLKSLQILNAQAEGVGRKMESLDVTLQAFTRIMLKPAEQTYTPAQVAAAASAAVGAGAALPPQENLPGEAYGYSEEEHASLEEARNHERITNQKERADALF